MPELANARDSTEAPVLVTGASGFVGSHTVKQLVKAGRRVRVFLRTTSSQEALQGLPVDICYGDVLDPASLRRAVKGCSTVFHCVVDPRFWLTDPAPIFRNNVEGLVNAMDVALEFDIGSFVFVSTIGTLGHNPDGPVTEEIEFNWYDRAPPYILSRRQAEDRFLEYCRDKGLPGVALCASNTYGPEDYQPTPQGKLLCEAANGNVRMIWNASQPTVDIRDVAQACLLAEKHGRIGERYIISNEFLSYAELLNMAAAEGGQGTLRVIPFSAVKAAAWLGEKFLWLLRRKDYVVRADAIYLSTCFKELDSSKARRELRWTPRPMAETVRDSVAWFIRRQQVARVGMTPIFGRW